MMGLEPELERWIIHARAHRVRHGLDFVTSIDFLVGRLCVHLWKSTLEHATGGFISPERLRQLGQRCVSSAPEHWLRETSVWGMRASSELHRVVQCYESLCVSHDEMEYFTPDALFGYALVTCEGTLCRCVIEKITKDRTCFVQKMREATFFPHPL